MAESTHFGAWLKKIDPEKDWQSIKSLHEVDYEIAESVARLGKSFAEDIFNFSLGIFNGVPTEDVWLPTVVYIHKSLVTKANRIFLDAPTQEFTLTSACYDYNKFMASKQALIASYLSLPDEQFNALVESKATPDGYIIFEIVDSELRIRNLNE